MRLVLGTFARSGIEACLGCDIATGVQEALRYYTQHPEPDTGPALPRFCHEQPPICCGDDLELAVEPEIEEALEREARESLGVSVEQLATHAVLTYLANLDLTLAGPAARPLTTL